MSELVWSNGNSYTTPSLSQLILNNFKKGGKLAAGESNTLLYRFSNEQKEEFVFQFCDLLNPPAGQIFVSQIPNTPEYKLLSHNPQFVLPRHVLQLDSNLVSQFNSTFDIQLSFENGAGLVIFPYISRSVSLGHFLNQPTTQPRHIYQLLYQLFTMTQTLESLHIMHHDLHHDNILVVRDVNAAEGKDDLRVYIIDWDLASFSDSLRNPQLSDGQDGKCAQEGLCNQFVPRFDLYCVIMTVLFSVYVGTFAQLAPESISYCIKLWDYFKITLLQDMNPLQVALLFDDHLKADYSQKLLEIKELIQGLELLLGLQVPSWSLRKTPKEYASEVGAFMEGIRDYYAESGENTWEEAKLLYKRMEHLLNEELPAHINHTRKHPMRPCVCHSINGCRTCRVMHEEASHLPPPSAFRKGLESFVIPI